LAHRYTLLWGGVPLIVKIFLLFWTKNYALGPKFKLNIKNLKNFKGFNFIYVVLTSNGNASETKANESFDNGVFFDIEAKRNNFQSEAKTSNSK
jgi:hypothetical protein